MPDETDPRNPCVPEPDGHRAGATASPRPPSALVSGSAAPMAHPEMVAWLRSIYRPGEVVELRALKVVDHPKYPPFTVAGYFDFDHFEALVEAAWKLTRKAMGVYVTCNPLLPDLLARAANRVKGRVESTAVDQDVLRRRSLVIDLDPVRRPPDVSATEGEKDRVWDRACALQGELERRGWPAPALVDSGNGTYLYHLIDLPVEDEGLVEKGLKALAGRFSDDLVDLDVKVFNPARLIKLPGTQSRKGDSTETRPHRWSRVISRPDLWNPVPPELLVALANEAPVGRPSPKADGASSPGSSPPSDRAKAPAPRPDRRVEAARASPEGRARAYIFAPGFPDSIAGQHGHDRLFHVACVLTDGFGLTEDQALPIFRDWNSSKAQPPESESQLRHKLNDAIKKHPSPSLRLLNADRDGRHDPKANGRAVTRRRAPGDDDDRGDAAPVEDAHGAADRLKRLKPTEGVVEAPDDPHKLARTYVAERYAHPDHPRLVYSNEDFHEYRDGCYRRLPDGDADVELTAAIKREFDRLYFEDLEAYRRAMAAYQIATKKGGDWEGSKPVPPEARKVKTGVFNDTRRALRSIVGVPHTYQQPCWLTPFPDAPPPMAVLPAQNALVDLSSVAIGPDGTIDLHAIKILTPTPAFFSPLTLHYPFDPDAPDPTRWLTFLEEVFPGDVESQRELQKWFGYLITMDTKQQKMLYLIGRSRSGKGTVVRVLTDLVGQLNCASPALMDLAEPFGLSNLPGKTLMTITDARISKDDKELARLQERLLKISGEDLSQINRKNKPIIEMKLLTRVVIASNEVPAFRDPSGAFKERMRPLRFQVSFAGKEDPDLFGKLRAEMGGILNWAIKGQALLVADGGFLVPRSARGLVRSLQEAATPLHVFLYDCCTTDKDATVTKDDLFLVYQSWCLRTANRVTPIQTFGKDLLVANPEIKEVRLRPRKEAVDMDTGEPIDTGKRGEKRPRVWKGIKFQPDVLERAQEEKRRKEERFQPRDWSSR